MNFNSSIRRLLFGILFNVGLHKNIVLQKLKKHILPEYNQFRMENSMESLKKLFG